MKAQYVISMQTKQQQKIKIMKKKKKLKNANEKWISLESLNVFVDYIAFKCTQKAWNLNKTTTTNGSTIFDLLTTMQNT